MQWLVKLTQMNLWQEMWGGCYKSDLKMHIGKLHSKESGPLPQSSQTPDDWKFSFEAKFMQDRTGEDSVIISFLKSCTVWRRGGGLEHFGDFIQKTWNCGLCHLEWRGVEGRRMWNSLLESITNCPFSHESLLKSWVNDGATGRGRPVAFSKVSQLE